MSSFPRKALRKVQAALKIRSRSYRLYLAYRKIVETQCLQRARPKYGSRYRGQTRPFVSVVIATWNRAQILTGRTLPAILAQTYPDFEVVVVGDACTDDTAERIRRLGDSRIRFFNLEERGNYPKDPLKCRQVAGTKPMNKAMDLAHGDWIAHCDDDDVFLTDHIENLLRFAQQGDYELVYGRARYELSPGEWTEGGQLPFEPTHVAHSTVLFRTYIRLFKANVKVYWYNVPVDGDLWRRMKNAGVRVGFLPQVVTLYPKRYVRHQEMESWARVKAEGNSL